MCIAQGPQLWAYIACLQSKTSRDRLIGCMRLCLWAAPIPRPPGQSLGGVGLSGRRRSNARRRLAEVQGRRREVGAGRALAEEGGDVLRQHAVQHGLAARVCQRMHLDVVPERYCRSSARSRRRSGTHATTRERARAGARGWVVRTAVTGVVGEADVDRVLASDRVHERDDCVRVRLGALDDLHAQTENRTDPHQNNYWASSTVAMSKVGYVRAAGRGLAVP